MIHLKITSTKQILFTLLLLIGVTTLIQAQTIISSDNFEGGWGNWNSSGRYSQRLASGWSPCLNGPSGSYSVRLKRNGSARLTSNQYDFSSYSDITITYNYATNNTMENNEGWFIEYSDDNGSNREAIKQTKK